MKPTFKDIEKTPSGYYKLQCDGRHDHSHHLYMYYTKQEVIELWKEQHPSPKKVD